MLMQISRREWIAGATGMLLGSPWLRSATTLPSAAPTLTRWQTRANQKRELAKGITWLTHEPIEFIIRRDGNNPNLAQHYQRMCDPENIKQMAAAGVRWGRIFFYKGF